MSDHVLGEFPDLTPDHLRHTFVKLHNCPGVGWCENHPRWHVARFKIHGTLDTHVWVAFGPHEDRGQDFPTHAEAINYAQKEATK